MRSWRSPQAALGRPFLCLCSPDFRRHKGFPRSVPIIAGVLVLIFSGGIRLSVRLYLRIAQRMAANGRSIRVLIVGAGDAGAMLVRRLAKPVAWRRKAVGFLDDDPAKIGAVVLGVRVVGDRKAIPEVVRSLDVDESSWRAQRSGACPQGNSSNM